MATLAKLTAEGQLVRIGGGLDDREQPCRLLYAFPHVVEWLKSDLPNKLAFYPKTELTPLEQVDEFFHDFVSGEDMAYYHKCHFMTPLSEGIWELKTIDVRMFGWFQIRSIFVIANVNTMDVVKKHHLYAGYRDDTIRRRNQLSLDNPKFVSGGYSVVF
jgi:hypothetical protein